MQASQQRISMKIVPPGKKKCVWMEAGVVSYKLCDNNYDCPTCSYDHAMQVKFARHKEAAAAAPIDSGADKFTQTWIDKMMLLPADRRKCRYMISGEVDRKICPNAYECGNCAFDQMMQERLQSEALPVHGRTHQSGFELAEDFYYHDGHTWAKPEYGGRVRVGLDDFARKLIGRKGSVELPAVGNTVKQGKAGFAVRRRGEVARVLAPIDGVVTHVNERILKHPDLVNRSPYEQGWLFIVEPSGLKKNLKTLYYGEDAQAFISTESERLFALAHDDIRLAADGGVSADDLFEEVGSDSWTEFIRVFLKG